MTGSRNRGSFTLGRTSDLPSGTRGKSRMHKGARTDPCGGRGVTRVPTATHPSRFASIRTTCSRWAIPDPKPDLGRLLRPAKTLRISISALVDQSDGDGRARAPCQLAEVLLDGHTTDRTTSSLLWYEAPRRPIAISAARLSSAVAIR